MKRLQLAERPAGRWGVTEGGYQWVVAIGEDIDILKEMTAAHRLIN
jgi:hypothetical protein